MELPKGSKPWASDDSLYDLEDDSDIVSFIREMSGQAEKSRTLSGDPSDAPSDGSERASTASALFNSEPPRGPKIYLRRGEKAPEGLEVHEGPKGGRWFFREKGKAHTDWVKEKKRSASKSIPPRRRATRTASELRKLKASPIRVAGGPSTVEMLNRARATGDDARYADFVRAMRANGRRDVERYLEGRVDALAEFSDGEWGVAILDTPDNRMLVFRDGWEPSFSGKWMGWPEDHWKLRPGEWGRLSEEQRANLECREQVSRWVASEFYERWMEAYHPQDYDEMWWRQGGSMTLYGQTAEWKLLVKRRAEKLRAETTPGDEVRKAEALSRRVMGFTDLY